MITRLSNGLYYGDKMVVTRGLESGEPLCLYTYPDKLTTTFDEIFTLEKFYAAMQRAFKGKLNRGEIRDFNRDRLGNLWRIMDVIGSNAYEPSPYKRKEIYEPKLRLIMAQPIRGRIVHQWIVTEVIIPYFVPRFIPTTYACIEGRGTLAAVNKAQEYMRDMRREYGNNFYIVQMDISKYFPSIDRDVAFAILASVMTDERLLDLMRRIIYDPDVESGIPIGNFTSQQIGNIVMDQADYFITRELGCRKYVRYMDDFIAFVPTKEEANRVLREAGQFVEANLHLKLNSKSRVFPGSRGLNFAGYKIHFDYRALRRRAKDSLRELINLYEMGQISTSEFVTRVTAWYGHARHADCARYVIKHLGKYRELLPRVFEP